MLAVDGNEFDIDGDPDATEAMRALEDFLRSDPVAIIRTYVEKNNLRMVDFFNQFDKDKDYRITPEDLKRGVKVGKCISNTHFLHKQLDSAESAIPKLICCVLSLIFSKQI